LRLFAIRFWSTRPSCAELPRIGKIVEAHGGAIAAEPAAGGGTRVRFSLPSVVARGAAPAASTSQYA
jgi:hypothetical protein